MVKKDFSKNLYVGFLIFVLFVVVGYGLYCVYVYNKPTTKYIKEFCLNPRNMKTCMKYRDVFLDKLYDGKEKASISKRLNVLERLYQLYEKEEIDLKTYEELVMKERNDYMDVLDIPEGVCSIA